MGYDWKHSKMAAIVRMQRRDSSQDLTTDVLHANKYLSSFQVEKFTYMFNVFFDIHGGDGIIQKEDIIELLEKFRNYCGFDKTHPRYLRMMDIMYAFYDCMVEQVTMEKSRNPDADGYDTWEEALKPHKVDTTDVTLPQWLNMWGKLCRGSAGISGFPDWVKLLGHMFFDIIDRDGDGVLAYDELKNFYANLIGIDKKDLEKFSTEAHRAMTANGSYTLDHEQYLFCFANFLLAKGIYGPGKWIFGVFDNSDMDTTYKVVYNDEED